MISKKPLILIWLTASALLGSAHAQDGIYTSSPEVMAVESLSILKNGYLLVRLSDRANIREKLMRYNEADHLKRFDALLAKEHSEIIEAFRKHYNFGQVLFFFRSQTQALLDGQWQNITFINTNNENVNPNTIQLKTFMIGEFSKMELKDSILVKQTNGEMKKEPKTSFTAFVLRDRNMAILNKKVGLHVRTIFRKNKTVVRIFNNKLYNGIGEGKQNKFK